MARSAYPTAYCNPVGCALRTINSKPAQYPETKHHHCPNGVIRNRVGTPPSDCQVGKWELVV